MDIPDRLRTTDPDPEDSEVVAASKLFQKRKESLGVAATGGVLNRQAAAHLFVGMDLPVDDLMELHQLVSYTSPFGGAIGVMTATGYIEGIAVGLLLAEQRRREGRDE